MTIYKAIRDTVEKIYKQGELIVPETETLKVVEDYFGITKEQACIFSFFFLLHIDDEFEFLVLNQAEDELNCEPSILYEYLSDFDVLFQKGLFRLWNNLKYMPETFRKDTQFIVAEEIVTPVLYNKPFDPLLLNKDFSEINALTFVDIVSKMSWNFLFAKYKFQPFLSQFQDVPFIKELLESCVNSSYPVALSLLDRLDWNLFCLSCYFLGELRFKDSVFMKNILEQTNLSSEHRVGFLRLFKEGKIPIITKHFLEIEKDYFGDDLKIRLGSKTRKEVFKGIEEIMTFKEEDNKALEKLRSKSIQEKELFYNEDNIKDIDRLKSLLLQKNYMQIRKRLQSKKLPLGMVILLYGPPGTGKTETVMQLARSTKRDLFHLNISQIRSCWVGESEKNIKGVFESYKKCDSRNKPILFFNEADSIVNKRGVVSEVNTAVNKMENTMQNIILEELERFDGICILTTNLCENFDPALERRILFKIELKVPEKKVKKEIWKSRLKGLSDKDYESLSDFDLSGGQIENVYRKSEIDEILYNKKPDIKSLSDFCKKEKWNLEGSSKIGFVEGD